MNFCVDSASLLSSFTHIISNCNTCFFPFLLIKVLFATPLALHLVLPFLVSSLNATNAAVRCFLHCLNTARKANEQSKLFKHRHFKLGNCFGWEHWSARLSTYTAIRLTVMPEKMSGLWCARSKSPAGLQSLGDL